MLSRSSSITSHRLASLVGAAAIAACTPAAADQATWGPWESLGGNVRSLPECQRQGQTTDCWVLSPGSSPTSGSTMSWLRGDGETWADWVNLDGTLRAAPECVSQGDEIDCFAANIASQNVSPLAWIHYDGQDWGIWQLLGGSVKQKPACLVGPGQRITCVALAAAKAGTPADGAGLWYYLFDGTIWQPPTFLAFPTNRTSTLRPMCADTARGTACFAVDTTKQLWVVWRDKDGTWGEWEQVAPGVGIAETPHCLASGVKLDCSSRSVGNRLISATFDGRSWSQWLETGSATVQSQPYCNKLGSGFDCYWTSSANELWHREQQHGVWLAEEDLGGTVTARPECLATPGGQRIDCFVQSFERPSTPITPSTLRHRAFD
jgi:hypothetical protein